MQTIYLDISNKGVIPSIQAKQGDVGRKFLAVITDNGTALSALENPIFSVWYDGDSGSGNYSAIDGKPAVVFDGKSATVELATQMLANAGDGEITLVMNDANGHQIGVWNIGYSVESVMGLDSEEVENYYTALSETATNAISAASRAEQAAEYAEESSYYKQNKLAWATDSDIDEMFAGTYEGVEDESPEGEGDFPGGGDAGGLAFDYTRYGLPELDLTGDVSGMNKDNAVTLNYAYGDRSGTCTCKWQGSSSLAYPKKNYTIKFDNAFEAADGWGDQKKYCLKANWIDHSHARNIVSCKLWGQMVKDRIVLGDSFDMDDIAGCVNSASGDDRSQYMTIENGVITTTIGRIDIGNLYYTGNMFAKGSYIVCWEAKPFVTTEDEDRAFVMAAGAVGNPTSESKMWTDYADKQLEDGWGYFYKEVEFPEDGSMIGFVGHRQPFQFRNIRAFPNILRNNFDINRVVGCIEVGTGANRTPYMNIEDGVITTGDPSGLGYIYFTGNKFYPGKYTVYWETKPTAPGTEDGRSFRIFSGTVGNYKAERMWTDYANGTLEDGWVYFTREIELTEDGSMIGFAGHAFPFQFRNITVTSHDSSLGGDDGSQAYGIKEIIKLPNGGAIDGFPCVVTINGEYKGLYTFNIPKDGWMFGMGESDTEAIVCANTHSAPTRFEAEATLTSADFEVEYAPDESNTEWIKTSLNRLINAVMNSDGTDLDTTVGKYLDWQSAIDYYIYTVLLRGGDMTDKNYLLATYDGTKWFFSAYDCDSTYGLAWDGQSFVSAKANPDFTGNWHKVMTLIRTYKKDELKARYAELRAGVMSDDNFTLAFTNFVGKIPDRMYMSDTEVWPLIPSSSANNLAQIVNWYRMRTQIVDEQIESL